MHRADGTIFDLLKTCIQCLPRLCEEIVDCLPNPAMEQMPVQFPFLGSDSPNFLAVLRNFIRPLYSVEARELINKGVILLFPSVFEAAA